MGALLIVLCVDYRLLARFAYPMYFANLVLLAVVLMHGPTIGGSQRWIGLGPVNFQPSEVMKIVLIVTLARYFDDRKVSGRYNLTELVKPAILVGIPFLLIAKQPDLGTACTLFVIFFFITVMNGLEFRSLMKLIAAGIVGLPLFWISLKEYQQQRILTLFNPEEDPLGRGYQIMQSKIAIGSGGFVGKGLFNGTQSKLDFLPAKHTDFIFSVWSEELGFLGASVVLFLYLIFLLRIMDLIYRAKDKFGSLIVVGIVSIFSFHIIFNVGMTLGLFPVVGIPLPFLSYGGSSLFTTLVAVGLLLNISMRRFHHV
jgi:rod shape determining protein RodA